jgi:hypothetical protein
MPGQRLRAFDRGHAAADHDLLRRVLVRDEQDLTVARLVAQRLRVGRPDPEQRRHRSGALLAGGLHGATADGDDLERRGQLEDAGGDERAELAQRVSRGTHAREARRLQDPVRRDLDRQQRRLDELRGGQGRLVPRRGDDVATDHGRCFLEHRACERVLRPRIGHPDEL